MGFSIVTTVVMQQEGPVTREASFRAHVCVCRPFYV